MPPLEQAPGIPLKDDRDDAKNHRFVDYGTQGRQERSRVDSISKAYHSRQKYSGGFTESFDNAVENYETLCRVFQLSDEEMARAFPMMLTGAAFSHYSHYFAKEEHDVRRVSRCISELVYKRRTEVSFVADLATTFSGTVNAAEPYEIRARGVQRSI